MKRLQISIGEDLDDALAVEAARRHTSKAALIREFVRERLGRATPAGTDPMALLLQEQQIFGYLFDDSRYDIGQKLDYLRATVEMAIDREDLGPEFRAFLVDLVQRKKLL